MSATDNQLFKMVGNDAYETMKRRAFIMTGHWHDVPATKDMSR